MAINGGASFPTSGGPTPVVSASTLIGTNWTVSTGTVTFSDVEILAYNGGSGGNTYSMASGGVVNYSTTFIGGGQGYGSSSDTFNGNFSSIAMDFSGTSNQCNFSANVVGSVPSFNCTLTGNNSNQASLTTNQSSALTVNATLNNSGGPSFSVTASNVTSLTFSLSSGNFTSINLSGAFDQASVDDILASCDSSGGSGCNLTIGGSSSTPSSAGLISIASLMGKGWSVSTN